MSEVASDSPYASSPSAEPMSRGRPLVTAVLVAHDGARWLPRLLETMAGQRTRPDRWIAVDTGSTDNTRQLLESYFGQGAVVSTDRDVSFGEALQLALQHAPPVSQPGTDEWLWILHDDCQLEPSTLHYLLAAIHADPELAVVGPKVREWPRRMRLLEVGLTISGTGQRLTGVESGEYDQGQHDSVRDCLAVPSVAMAIRRTAWDQLGGFDPRLPLFGEDVDLGWRAARAGLRTAVCPDAVVYHAEASARGQRSIDVATGPPGRIAREHALYTLLVNSPAWKLPWLMLRLTVGSLLRCVGWLVLKAPTPARDEVVALGSMWSRPFRIWSGRRARRGTNSVAHADVRPLLAPWYAPYRQGVDLVGQVVSEAFETVSERMAPPATAGVETGPVSEEAESLEVRSGFLTRLLAWPMTLVTLALVVLSFFGGVDLFGSGKLRGGALLPAAPGALEWWELYAESWHPVATGSDLPAPPYVAVLAVLATLFFGNAWLVVDLLIGFAVPLTALSGYVLTRRLLRSRMVAIWAAVAYGFLPVLTGAVAQGRLGTVAGAMLAPLVVRVLIAMVMADTRQRRWQLAWVSGLMLSLLVSFVPMAWVAAALMAFVVWVLWSADYQGEDAWRMPAQLLTVLAVPLLLLLPWLLHLGLDLEAWVSGEAGYEPGAAGDPASRWDILLGRAGGAGAAPGLITAVLGLAALLALLRTDRRRAVAMSWFGAVAWLAVVAPVQRLGEWPGFALVMVYGALICAAAIGGDGVVQRLTQVSFSWRQPLTGAVVVLAGLVPVASAVWWLFFDSESLVRRQEPVDIPLFMADAQLGNEAPRTLVIDTSGPESGVHLSRGPGLFIGHDAVSPEPPEELIELVARLTTDPTSDDVTMLADLGVRYVVLRSEEPDVVAAIDSAPGVRRASTDDDRQVAWQLDSLPGAVRVATKGDAFTEAVVLPSSDGSVDTGIESGADGRSLILAEAADGGWQATLGDRELEPVEIDGWGQGFELPADAGELTVDHDSGRSWWLVWQVFLLGLVIVFCLPGKKATHAAL